MIAIFKYQTEHITLYVAYTNGWLDAVEVTQRNTANMVDVAAVTVPVNEETARNSSNYSEVKRMTVHAKIRLWCAAYKQHRGLAYNVKATERANLAKVAMNEQLLTAYFTSNEYWATTNRYDLGTYIREINKIKDLLKNGQQHGENAAKFPNQWKPDLLKSLQADQVQAYFAHLRSLGFSPIKDGQGRVTKWSR